MKTLSTVKIIGAVMSLSTVFLVSGCNTLPEKSSVAERKSAEKVQLAPTLDFIPEVVVDTKTGNPVSYQAKENPYLVKKRLDPDAIDKFIRVKRAKKNGDSKTAERLLQALMDSDKSLSGPYVMSGDLAREKGELNQAFKFYEEALRINPNNVNAYLRLAYVERQRGNYLKAQNWLAQALKVWPDFPEAHLNLGVLYDLYLNHPINGQRHLEAYQYLTNFKSQEVEKWINEIRSRTRMKRNLAPPANSMAAKDAQ